ncbi:MAG: long-chain fatty acid--CoA ligase [Leptospiraceae bacterium]|nr:long-chain fatty acid--CoA ligase [Leptospiraceae bacterium]MDW7976968.1 long-chain fatty acid--CoA ligase [Leptospiraceae bacterium]
MAQTKLKTKDSTIITEYKISEPRTFYELYLRAESMYPERKSFLRRRGDGTIDGYSFSEMRRMVEEIASGLREVGLQKGDKVLFLCDNSNHWMLTNVGIITAGGVCVPRATDVTIDDIIYITNHSEAKFAIVQNHKTYEKLTSLLQDLPTLRKENIFILEDDKYYLLKGDSKSVYEAIMKKGQKVLEKDPDFVRRLNSELDPHEMSVLIYTSGTTGTPKGVMLTQNGWIASARNSLAKLELRESDTALSLLPPWHAFEQIVEYTFLYFPIPFMITDIHNLRQDLVDFQPTTFPSVPRIWESLYNGILSKIKKESKVKQSIFFFFLKVGEIWHKNKSILGGYDFQIEKKPFLKDLLDRTIALIILTLISPLKLISLKVFAPIKKALGGKLRSSLSGGSALPEVVDRFLSAIGLNVTEGYGMTESSGVISVRDFDMPTPGTVGTVLNGYQIKLKDEKGNDVKHIPGAKGTLWIKSEQVTLGYYKRDDLNKVVFDEDGFFDTGDLMRINWRGQLFFTGRAKDTIVLAGGENVEPVPIEDKLLQSEYIDQVLVVGDERKTLGVLIVPKFDLVKEKIPNAPDDYSKWNEHPEIRQLFRNEITRIINPKNGFKSFELIPKDTFYIVPRQFDPETEMTRTLKLKRPVIKEHFKREIELMYQR